MKKERIEYLKERNKDFRRQHASICVWMPHDMKRKIHLFLSENDMKISDYIRMNFQHIIKKHGL